MSSSRLGCGDFTTFIAKQKQVCGAGGALNRFNTGSNDIYFYRKWHAVFRLGAKRGMEYDWRMRPATDLSRIKTYYAQIGMAARLLFVLLTWNGLVHGQSPNQSHHAAGKADSTDVASSKKVFEKTCAGCHGLDGRGGERGPNIATREEVARRRDAELFKTIRDGITASGMPSFASLGTPQLNGLVSYLRSLQGKGPNAAVPGNPKSGETLFFGAAHCSDCHMVQGKGGFIGPDLSVYAAASSVDEIKKAIVSPGGRDPSRVRGVVTVTLHDGKRLEGIVRNEDNFSVQLQSMDGSFHLVQKSEVGAITRSQESLMPADYGKTLSPSQLDDLVGYLMTAARKATEKPAKKQNWEDESL
jgi:cytochrome c oxidase cbb3-type subunit 3